MYGLDGQLGGRYLDATRSVLRRIATVAEQVNKSFEVQVSETAPPPQAVPHRCVLAPPIPPGTFSAGGLPYVEMKTVDGHEN